jgi:hypothetical protein
VAPQGALCFQAVGARSIARLGPEQPEQRRNAADHLQGSQVAAQGLDGLVAAAQHLLAHQGLRQISALAPVDRPQQHLGHRIGGAGKTRQGLRRPVAAQ